MPRPRILVTVALLALLAVSASDPASAGSAVTAAALSNAFTVNGNVGSYVLEEGSDYLDDSNATITMYDLAYDSFELAAAGPIDHSWQADFRPPIAGDFVAGTTYVTQQLPSYTTRAWMNVHTGRSCPGTSGGISTGTLTVKEFTRDPATRQVTRFAASFSQLCDGYSAAITGEIRWQSDLAIVGAETAPSLFDFGIQGVGSTGDPKTVTVTARGSTPLTLGTAAITGPGKASFSVTADGCAGLVLTAGQTCTVTVTPHAAALNTQLATLEIPDNTVAQARRVPLSLEGVTPSVTVATGADFIFGRQPIGPDTYPIDATLTSTGTLPVTFGSPVIAGKDPAAFSLSSTTCAGKTLHLQETCDVLVIAHPTAAGDQHAVVALPYNGPGGEVDLPLSVIGTDSSTGTFYPLQPSRILDTRLGVGAPRAAVGPHGVLHLKVAGAGGVAASGVEAVVLNVTATSPTASSYLSVYPSGSVRPTASNLNFPKGWTGANSVTVGLGTDGSVDIYNFAGSTQVIVDVTGFYALNTSVVDSFGQGGRLHPVTPARLLDTRFSTGPVPAMSSVQVAADFGADNAHVTAIAVNVTAVHPVASGYLTSWDGSHARPVASTLNFVRGAIVPNLAVVAVTPGGASAPTIAVFNGSTGATDIVVDLVGYFDDGTLSNGLIFHPIVPTRIADSRTGYVLHGALGPAAMAEVPSSLADFAVDRRAVSLNVTAIAPTAATYLTLWPAGTARPVVSTVNAGAGQVVPNAAITAVSFNINPNQTLDVYNSSGTTNVVIDVSGTYGLAPAGLSP